MDYTVDGAMRDTGETITVKINANDSQDALQKANQLGILVSRVTEIQSLQSRALRPLVVTVTLIAVIILATFAIWLHNGYSEQVAKSLPLVQSGDDQPDEDAQQDKSMIEAVTEEPKSRSVPFERSENIATDASSKQSLVAIPGALSRPPTPEQVYSQTLPAIVQVSALDSQHNIVATGSGFYVTNDGVVATNYHVVKEADSLAITDAAGHSHEVLGFAYVDCLRDFILLVTDVTGSPYLTLAGTEPEVGSSVYAIGNPQGLINTFSDGMISGIRSSGTQYTLLQTTAPISPGSSGGPLLNPFGEVLGINTMQYKDGQLLNFSLSSACIRDALKQRPRTTHELDRLAHYWVRQAERIGYDNWIDFAVIEAAIGDLEEAAKYAQLAEQMWKQFENTWPKTEIDEKQFYFHFLNQQLAVQYARLGFLDESKSIFDGLGSDLPRSIDSDLVVAFARAGNTDRAIEMASRDSFLALFSFLFANSNPNYVIDITAQLILDEHEAAI